MASVFVAHICEASVKLPMEGSRIDLVFCVSWMGMELFVLNDELPQWYLVVLV